MPIESSSPFRRQSGVILVTSLVFLIAITLLTVASMRSSNIGLHMAQNEESRVMATQGAQALADAVASDPNTTPVIGEAGFTICTATETNCQRNDLTMTNSTMAAYTASGVVAARVERMSPALRPAPRGVESSIDKFVAASFEVTSTYDRVGEGLGRQTVVEGILVLVPTQ
jgi:Tfp pilus assembly protein PilX